MRQAGRSHGRSLSRPHGRSPHSANSPALAPRTHTQAQDDFGVAGTGCPTSGGTLGDPRQVRDRGGRGPRERRGRNPSGPLECKLQLGRPRPTAGFSGNSQQVTRGSRSSQAGSAPRASRPARGQHRGQARGRGTPRSCRPFRPLSQQGSQEGRPQGAGPQTTRLTAPHPGPQHRVEPATARRLG